MQRKEGLAKVTQARTDEAAGIARHELSVEATELFRDGSGLCSAPSAPHLCVHVPGLLPGEHAVVEVLHESPHFATQTPTRVSAWGRIKRRLNASVERAVPACAAYGSCGGCTLQHLDYAAQLRFKQQLLVQALSPVVGEAARAIPICVAAEPLGYRSRVKLTFAQDGAGRLLLGAYAPRSHQVLPMSGCKVNAPSLTALARSVVEETGKLRLTAYDEASGRGTLRYLLLRETAEGQQQLSLVAAELGAFSPQIRAQLVAALVARHPQLKSIVLHHNPSRGNALLSDLGEADADQVIYGEAHLWEVFGPLRLRVSARSFLQINRDTAARIYAAAASFVPSAASLLDLYCGVGGMGLSALLSGTNTCLYGIEGNPSAVADATASAKALGARGKRAQFVCGDVAALLPNAPRGAHEVILLNPPRRGCDRQVIDSVIARAPRRIIYVSCSPESLARDLQIMSQSGYVPIHIVPYDMHPGTPHIETLAVLERP